ncbi:hypothetical protein DPMN_078477 [Dreissena polymorpha]|uniref:Uncharacterized protein n=1 Tax=Dreissena polymorpha TaxID=45954 RepID=A0A9D4BQI8_DREPO|nr:hypothetical protein DPMN_078477 [Dreissena polymorpha]
MWRSTTSNWPPPSWRSIIGCIHSCAEQCVTMPKTGARFHPIKSSMSALLMCPHD